MRLEDLLKAMGNGLKHSVEVEYIHGAAPEMLALLLEEWPMPDWGKKRDALIARLRKECEG